jgi:ABC-type sugar transport system permease subunit
MSAIRLSAGPRDRRASDAKFALVLVAPTLLLVTATLLFPLLNSMWVSLLEVDPYSGRSRFAGVDNYVAVFTDPLFGLSLRNTLYFAAISIVGITGMGLFMALAMNERSWLQGVTRTALIIPWSLSQVVASITWGWIYSGTFGALNGVLLQLGLIGDYQSWFSAGLWSFNFIALAFVWSVSPYAALLFLAGLQAIPAELYQAAKVDGANVWNRFRHVTLPWLRSSLLVVLVIATLDGFLAFTMIYVLTSGGPGNTTTVLAWWGYATTFTYNDLGKGAAILYFLSALLLAISAVYLRYLHRPSVEGGGA